MYKLIVIFSCLAVAFANDIIQIQAEDGQEYILVPAIRQRRETGGKTDWKVEDPARLKILHEQIFIDNDKTKLLGSVYASKNFADRQEPVIAGGKVQYQNVPTGTGIGVVAEHARHQGTNVGVEGVYNIYKNGPLSVDVTGQYSRQYGGPQGTQPPQWQTLLNGRLNF